MISRTTTHPLEIRLQTEVQVDRRGDKQCDRWGDRWVVKMQGRKKTQGENVEMKNM